MKNANMGTILAISLTIGVLCGVLSFLVPHVYHYNGIPVGDIGPPLIGLSRFLKGGSAYSITTEGVVAYPFVTYLILAPLLLVPLSWTVSIFNGISSGVLAFAILSKGRPWQLLVLVSVQYMSALYSVQWSPLIMASILLPSLAPISFAKPQLAVASLATGRWTWKTLTVGLSVVGLSFIIYPAWPIDWLSKGALSSYIGHIPLLIGPGIVLVISALFWKDDAGRLLLAMAIVPQRIWYDQLLLFMIPKSWRSLSLLLACSWIMILATPHADGDQSYAAWLAAIWLFYLPALGILIWERRKDLSNRFFNFRRAHP